VTELRGCVWGSVFLFILRWGIITVRIVLARRTDFSCVISTVSVLCGCSLVKLGIILSWVIVSMFLFVLGLLLFVADSNLRSGGRTMITLDVLGVLMYAQLLLSVVLFLALQLTALFAYDRVEQVGDWVVYRGTWVGLAIQCLSMAIVAVLVFYAQTDHTRVTYTLILIMANAVWFTSLRLVFLVADYRHKRQIRGNYGQD